MRQVSRLLAISLFLGLSSSAFAAPESGSYEIEFVGRDRGHGTFTYNSQIPAITGFQVVFGDLITFLDFSPWLHSSTPEVATCFVEWLSSPPNQSCSVLPSLTSLGAQTGGLFDFYNFTVAHEFEFIPFGVPQSGFFTGRYFATPRNIPEPPTLALSCAALLCSIFWRVIRDSARALREAK